MTFDVTQIEVIGVLIASFMTYMLGVRIVTPRGEKYVDNFIKYRFALYFTIIVNLIMIILSS